MASIQVRNVTKQFGPNVVLENVSLEIRTGETVGLVGPNGAGKTTLFRLIMGQIEPDLGTVTRSRGLQVGLLAQEPRLDSARTLHDEVASVFEDLLSMERGLLDLSHEMADAHDQDRLPALMDQYDRLNARFEAAGGHGFQARLNEILGGLGFSQNEYSKPVSTLSGGQKCRAGLAKLLLEDHRLLLLDEPTNHLDIDATRWLEKYLAGHRGGAVIVSHDRYLLDKLATRIVEVADRQVASYPGNYSNYVQVKQLRLVTQQRQYEKDRRFIEKERAFIAKHISGQRTREARGRRTRLERRLAEGEFVLETARSEGSTSFDFSGGPMDAGVEVLTCTDLAKSFGDQQLFADLNLRVMPGDRVGITGANGTGKTTLLRIALGQVPADAGTAELSSRFEVGYYDQEHSDLIGGTTVLDYVGAARPDLDQTSLRSFLGRFRFRGEDAFKPVDRLSGGEQSRVRLAKLVLSAPQVLILDEPTNHLDIPSREALEEALSGFDGTILAVSHDRYFLDRMATRLLVIDSGGHRLFHGNYSEYRRILDAEAAQTGAATKTQPGPKPARARRRRAQASQPASPYDSLTLEALEELILAKEARLEEVHQQFGSEQVYRDPQKTRGLQSELQSLKEELTALNRAWEERANDT